MATVLVDLLSEIGGCDDVLDLDLGFDGDLDVGLLKVLGNLCDRGLDLGVALSTGTDDLSAPEKQGCGLRLLEPVDKPRELFGIVFSSVQGRHDLVKVDFLSERRGCDDVLDLHIGQLIHLRTTYLKPIYKGWVCLVYIDSNVWDIVHFTKACQDVRTECRTDTILLELRVGGGNRTPICGSAVRHIATVLPRQRSRDKSDWYKTFVVLRTADSSSRYMCTALWCPCTARTYPYARWNATSPKRA